uniref:Uncharacterized protein n=1 Tax=Sphaerodactylus townsendi TaxID=933632 RepID=A0ACB8FIH1_9SAUR
MYRYHKKTGQEIGSWGCGKTSHHCIRNYLARHVRQVNLTRSQSKMLNKKSENRPAAGEDFSEGEGNCNTEAQEQSLPREPDWQVEKNTLPSVLIAEQATSL